MPVPANRSSVPRRARWSRARLAAALCAAALLLAACGSPTEAPPRGTPGGNPGGDTVPTTPLPLVVPDIAREFRGLWVATVANIDWPSRTTLTVTQQQDELIAILERARTAGLNAVVLQIRAAGDATYPSALEPWSRSFTGTQGTDPGWDPLSFAVTQAHARGLELHAWFNPFRAGNLSDTARLAPSHLVKRRPEVARAYCTQLWFEPSSQVVHDHVINVVRDVIARYDIDAVHLDDYFYPYPDSRCSGLDFPDSTEFAQYRAGGGTLARADWRRDNVNRFVERLYRETHAASPHTRVGISPFGIWRPGSPAGITGLDAYASIYADSRLWLQRGWVDYFAPQLYWSIASSGQSFTALLDWWHAQNPLRRHLWPGLAAYRVLDGTGSAFATGEIVSQVAAIRARSLATGTSSGLLLYNTTVLMQNRDGLASTLQAGSFASGALVPASSWLDPAPPPAPAVAVTSMGATGRRIAITPGDGEAATWWLVRWRVAAGGAWAQRLVPAATRTVDISPAGAVDAIVVNAVDRVGNASAQALWRP